MTALLILFILAKNQAIFQLCLFFYQGFSSFMLYYLQLLCWNYLRNEEQKLFGDNTNRFDLFHSCYYLFKRREYFKRYYLFDFMSFTIDNCCSK